MAPITSLHTLRETICPFKGNLTIPTLNMPQPIQCSISNFKIHRCQHRLLGIKLIVQRPTKNETSFNFTSFFWKWDTGFNFQNVGCRWSPFLCIFTKQVEKLLFLFISKQNPTLKVCTQTPKQSLEQTRRLHHSNKAPGSITCTKHIYRVSPRTPFTGSYTQDSTWC